MPQDVEAFVKKHVAEILNIDESEIDRETNLVNDLQADSMSHVELVMDLENEFDIELPDKAAATIKTIGDVITLVEETIARGKDKP